MRVDYGGGSSSCQCPGGTTRLPSALLPLLRPSGPLKLGTYGPIESRISSYSPVLQCHLRRGCFLRVSSPDREVCKWPCACRRTQGGELTGAYFPHIVASRRYHNNVMGSHHDYVSPAPLGLMIHQCSLAVEYSSY